jgi:hypothetical protein
MNHLTARGRISTHSGGRFDFLDPAIDEILLEDVAHALAHTNRYGGHAGTYSVAQHCVLLSRWLGREFLWSPDTARDALMHDATEAYSGDIPAPLKALIPAFASLEDNLDDVMARRFDVRPLRDSPDVLRADRRIIVDEMIALMGKTKADFSHRPLGVNIEPWSPSTAKHLFLERADALGIS